MNLRKLLGIILLAGGTVVLIYRGFTYTSEKHTAHLGPIDLQVKEKKRLDIPVWAGVIAIVAGAGFLVLPQRKS